MRLEPDSFPIRTLRRRAKLHIPAPTASFKVKTVLITGASGGICSEAARILIDLGAERLIFGVRNLDKGKKLAEELTRNFKDGDGPEILVWSLELKSFASVREFAQKAASLPRLDNVIIGAATALNERKVSEEGWEETLKINHLSNALLTILLLPTLASSAEKHKIKPVLTNISSWSIQSSGFFAKKWWKVRKGDLLENISHHTKPAGSGLEYGHSKIAYLYFIRELCDQLDKGIDRREGSIIINSVDPGTASTYVTELFMAKGPPSLFLKYIRRPTEHCARTVVNACIPRLETHGKLIVDLSVSMYPKYMENPKGRQVQTGFWEETKAALQKFSPGVSLYFGDIEAGRYPTPSQREGHADPSIQDSVVTEGNLETPES